MNYEETYEVHEVYRDGCQAVEHLQHEADARGYYAEAERDRNTVQVTLIRVGRVTLASHAKARNQP